MTIMHRAQAHPELFGDRVVGAALFSTAAGEMADYSPIPVLPGRVFSQLALTLLAGPTAFPNASARAGRGLGPPVPGGDVLRL